MSGIRLHPERGVNPFLTYCPRCKGEASELLLVGADDGIYSCGQCDARVIGRGHGVCPKCKHRSLSFTGDRVREGQRLPASSPCDSCREELKWHEAIVARGGVYFRCVGCGASGVVPGDRPFAAEVRRAHNLPAVDPPGNSPPCGVEAPHCPQCEGAE